MRQSGGILNSESMHAEQCGSKEIVHWPEALMVTALPSTAALCGTLSDMQADTKYSHAQCAEDEFPTITDVALSLHTG